MSYSLSVNTLSNLFPPDSGVAARVGDQLAPSLQAYLTQSGGIDVWVDDVLHTGQPISGASVVRMGRCKANRQYLLTLQVSRYCLLALQSSALLGVILCSFEPGIAGCIALPASNKSSTWI